MLLKAAKFQESRLSATSFNLNDIAAEAKEMIDAAQRQSARLLEQAQQQAQQLRQQEKEQGRREGFQQGLEQGRRSGRDEAFQQARSEFQSQAADLLAMLRNSLSDFDHRKAQLLWQAEQDTVILALAVTDKLTKLHGRQNPHVALENVRAALKLVAQNTSIVIELNPQDLEHIQNMAQENENLLGNYAAVIFQADPAITPGGCRICTEHGQINGELEAQLDCIAHELVMCYPCDKPEQNG